MPGPTSRETATHVVFIDARRVLLGSEAEATAASRRHSESGSGGMLLVFEIATGKQVELDGSDAAPGLPSDSSSSANHPVKGPGRPRLGVLSREISLLPRHWDWLEAQPSGISAALRRLVEHAMHHPSEADRRRSSQTAASRFLFAMAGNRPNYEEACRALFAADAQGFGALIRPWPKGIRDIALMLAQDAFTESQR